MELVTTLPADTPMRDVPPTVRRIERLGFDTALGDGWAPAGVSTSR